jgi:MGT family glycosyltransferase
MLYRYLAFTFAPRQLLGPDTYVAPVMHFIQPSPADGEAELPEDNWEPPIDRPLVYGTIGTVFNSRNEEVLGKMARAMAGQPYDAVLTIGPGRDTTPFSWTADTNVAVRQYVSQTRILPHCDAVLAHGGFHTVVGALSHGVPLILLPLGGDHHRNAKWCAAQGAARVLPESRRQPAQIRRAVERVLTDPDYRMSAEKLQTAIHDLPDMAEAVKLVELLIRTKTPIPREDSNDSVS